MRVGSSLLPIAFVVGCAAPNMPVPAAPDAGRYWHAVDHDPAVRAKAAGELVGDAKQRANDQLVALAKDPDPMVRAAAVAAMAERRDTSLVDTVEGVRDGDAVPDVRKAAADAHAKLWPWTREPRTAAGLSLLCPGCGQLFYLHERPEGAAMLVAGVALLGSGFALTSGGNVSLDSGADSVKVPIGTELLLVGQNLWFYSIFDAYRDARVMRGDVGYSFSITHESLGELAAAPWNPKVLKSPWVWLGVPAALALGLGISYAADPDSFRNNPSLFGAGHVDKVNVLGHEFGRAPGFALGDLYFAPLFNSVGVGEESLFRGLIQTELEERLGTWGGLAAASAIFGAVHFFNFASPGADPKQALIAVPTIAVLGSSLGMAYIKTGHKLSTGVAMHFWYDFLLSVTAFAFDPTHQPFVVNMSTTM